MVKTTTKTKTIVAVAIVSFALLGILSSLYYYGTRISEELLYGGSGSQTNPAGTSYKIQAKMTGASSCDSGIKSGTTAQCGLKYVSPIGSQAGAKASINTANNTITVIGYGEFNGQKCTNTATLNDQGGTATCSAEGRTYTAHGEKTTGYISPTPAPTGPTCSINFNPSAITKGQTTTSSWTSSGDADGKIQYSCRCADGNCEYVNSQWGGKAPDIYESSDQNVSGSTNTFGPPETVVCTATVKNSAGVTKTCSNTLTVNSSGTPAPSGAIEGTATCEAGGRTYTAYGKKEGTDYTTQAKMSGASSCNSGLVDSKSTKCGLKYVSPMGTASGTKAEINTTGYITVIGYGEYNGQVCTKTVKMTEGGSDGSGGGGLDPGSCVVGKVSRSTSGDDYGTYIWDCNCKIVKVSSELIATDTVAIGEAEKMGVCLGDLLKDRTDTSTAPIYCSNTGTVYTTFSSCKVACVPGGGYCTLYYQLSPYQCSTTGTIYNSQAACISACGGGTPTPTPTPGTGAYSVRAQILSGTYNGKAVSCDSGWKYSDDPTKGVGTSCTVTDPNGREAKASAAFERSGLVSISGSAQYRRQRSCSGPDCDGPYIYDNGTQTCYGSVPSAMCSSTQAEKTCTINYTGTTGSVWSSTDKLENLVYKVTAQRTGNPPCGCTSSCPIINPDIPPIDTCVVGSLLTQGPGGVIGTWISNCSCQYVKLSDTVLSQSAACTQAKSQGVCLTGSTLCP